jgi:hypothetical protein
MCCRDLNDRVWKAIRHWDFTKKTSLGAVTFLRDRFLAEDSRLSSVSCELDRDAATSGFSEKLVIELAEAGRLFSIAIRSARPTFVEELFSSMDPDNVRLLHLHVAYNNATIPFVLQCVNLEHLFFRAMHPENWKEFVEALSEGAFPQLRTLKISLELQSGNKGGQIHDLKKAFKKAIPPKLQRLDVGRQETVSRLLIMSAGGKTLDKASRCLLAVPLHLLNLSIPTLAEGAVDYIKTHLDVLDIEMLDHVLDALLQGESRTSITAKAILVALLNSLPYVLCVIEDFSPRACVLLATWLRDALEHHGSVLHDIDKWVDTIDTFDRKADRFQSVQAELHAEMSHWRSIFYLCMIENIKVCHDKLKVANRKYFIMALKHMSSDRELKQGLLGLGDFPGGSPLWAYFDKSHDVAELMALGVINPTLADKSSNKSLIDNLCDPAETGRGYFVEQFVPLISPTLKWVGENLPIDEAQSIFDRVQVKFMTPQFLELALPSRRDWLLELFTAIGSPPSVEDKSKITRRFMKQLTTSVMTKKELYALAGNCFMLFPDSILPTTTEEAKKYVKAPESFPFDAAAIVLEAAAEVARRRDSPMDGNSEQFVKPSKGKCIIC